MAYLGRRGASAALTSADIPDSSITTAKIVDGTVAEGDLAFSTATQAELDAQRTNSSITTLGTVTAGVLEDAVTYRNINQDLGTSDSPKFSDVSWDGSGVITPVSVAATSYLGASSTNDLATLSITEEGIYSVFCNLRWAFVSGTGYLFVYLHSGSEIGNKKMQLERTGTHAGTANINIHTSWIMDFHNFNQYPYSVTLKAFNTAASTKFLQNDTNGLNNFGAIKFARSSTTSAGVTQIGT